MTNQISVHMDSELPTVLKLREQGYNISAVVRKLLKEFADNNEVA